MAIGVLTFVTPDSGSMLFGYQVGKAVGFRCPAANRQMTEAMKKHVGWFLIGAFIALCLISYTNVRKIDTLTNEKNAATQRADSLQHLSDSLLLVSATHEHRADSLEQVADSLSKIDPVVILDHRMKLNRYATTRQIGEGLLKKVP